MIALGQSKAHVRVLVSSQLPLQLERYVLVVGKGSPHFIMTMQRQLAECAGLRSGMLGYPFCQMVAT